MNAGLSLVIEQVPILLGAAFLLLLIRFNPYKKKFVVQHNSKVNVCVQPNDVVQTHSDQTVDYLYDYLIISGIFPREKKASTIRVTALNDLGLIEVDRIKFPLQEKIKSESLNVLAKDAMELQTPLLEKSQASGFLLAHLLNSTLDFKVIE
ncbi:MAG: hypothetical protein ACREBF_05035 [Candidatus Micrarchaeales archaeon]